MFHFSLRHRVALFVALGHGVYMPVGYVGPHA